MILSGAIVTIVGLSGLIYCILKAFRAKKSGLKGEELSKQLKKLVLVNLISLFLSAIGYFPDFLIKVKTADGSIKTHLIEVKPTKDMRPPTGGKGKKKSTVLYEMKTYLMNRDKFASARKWCDDRNISFDIWTEKHLQQKG